MRINVKVVPNSKKEEVVKEENGSFTVKVREKPQKGNATIRALKVLSGYFNKPVSLVRGAFSREKIVEVSD